MNYWLETATRNILRFSQTQDFNTAKKEWEPTGAITEYEDAEQYCELCEHPNLKYHFEIANVITKKRLWVGSKCIEKFKGITKSKLLAIHVNSMLEQLLNVENPKEYVTDLRNHKKYSRIELATFCKDHFVKHEFMTPKMLLYLFKRFEKFAIPFKKPAFKLNLTHSVSKEQLAKLTVAEREILKPCLSKKKLHKMSLVG